MGCNWSFGDIIRCSSSPRHVVEDSMSRILKSTIFKILFVLSVLVLFVSFYPHNKSAYVRKDADGYIVFLEPENDEWKVFREIEAAAGLSGIDFAITEDRDINGQAHTNKRVSITNGTFTSSKYFFNDYRIAAVIIAHELAHTQDPELWGPGSWTNREARNSERRADYQASVTLYHSKYGCEAQAEAVKVWSGGSLSRRQSSSHASDYERLQSSIANCDSLNKTGRLPDNLYYE